VTYNYGKSCIISLTVYSVRPVIIYHFAHCAVEHSLPVIPNPARATPSAYTMRIDSKMPARKSVTLGNTIINVFSTKHQQPPDKMETEKQTEGKRA